MGRLTLNEKYVKHQKRLKPSNENLAFILSVKKTYEISIFLFQNWNKKWRIKGNHINIADSDCNFYLLFNYHLYYFDK